MDCAGGRRQSIGRITDATCPHVIAGHYRIARKHGGRMAKLDTHSDNADAYEEGYRGQSEGGAERVHGRSCEKISQLTHRRHRSSQKGSAQRNKGS